MAPPKRLKLGEVPAYIYNKYGVEVSRQTVYNWAKKGVRGIRLRTIRKANKWWTTAAWVDDFVTDTGNE